MAFVRYLGCPHAADHKGSYGIIVSHKKSAFKLFYLILFNYVNKYLTKAGRNRPFAMLQVSFTGTNSFFNVLKNTVEGLEPLIVPLSSKKGSSSGISSFEMETVYYNVENFNLIMLDNISQ